MVKPKAIKKSSVHIYVMLCGVLLLGLSSTIQATASASYDYTLQPSNDVQPINQEIYFHSKNMHRAAASAPLPLDQLLIPANGQCLYTTIIMGYLLPVREATDEVTTRINQLFGMQPAYYLNELHQTLQNPIHYLTYLHSDAFSTLVSAFMTRMQIKKGTWGGPHEIQTIANKLKVNIQAHYPDPSNPTNLVQSDLTKPAQANADITLHIIHDKVHPAEVLTQTEKASAKDNPHYQHYRLKYTFTSSISTPVLLSTQLLMPHKIGLQQKNQPYSLKWFKVAEIGSRKWLRSLYHNYNINVGDKNNDNNTALILSACKGHLDCVKFLTQQGANVILKRENSKTALTWTKERGQAGVINFLPNFMKKEQFDKATLRKWFKAAKTGNRKLLEELYHKYNISVHITRNASENTALLYSAYSGHLDCLKFLLQKGADINTKNTKGSTALLLSAYKGYLSCVKYLLQQGADINARTKKGSTALLLSVWEGHLDCVKYLRQQGADIKIRAKDGYTALLRSAYRGHLDCVKYLLQQGAHINAKTKKGSTAALLSAQEGHVDCIKFLLQQGADINSKNTKGNTALLLSAYKGHVNCVKFLLQQGADIHTKSSNGSTALQYSAREGHLYCVKYLVAQGADIHRKNKYGYTPFMLSAYNQHVDCVNFLFPLVDLRKLNLQGMNFSQATLPKNLSSVNFTNAILPKDLSNHNLTHANLTGQRFTATNFEGTELEGAILTNTLCDYQQYFQDEIKANKLSGSGGWYCRKLPKDLKSIAQVYPHLSQDSHKAELLQIASGLAYLPYWECTFEFGIKAAYWSCKLLLLKKQLSSELKKQLVCALAYALEHDAKKYCWQTNYPQNQIEKAKEAPHDDFDQYLKAFQAGLQKYNCKSKESLGYKWYKDNIKKNIQGLQKTYPKLTALKLQKEAVNIAFQLSKIYQNQHWDLLFRYLFLQNRLIRFKISAGVGFIHYNTSPLCQTPLLKLG